MPSEYRPGEHAWHSPLLLLYSWPAGQASLLAQELAPGASASALKQGAHAAAAASGAYVPAGQRLHAADEALE